MNKLSVIIPTVQNKIKVLIKSIGILERDNVVDEIIVINNEIEKSLPEEIINSPKVRVITPENNLYVNPSWNLGIKGMKNDRFLLLNDDILFEEGFCSKVMSLSVWEQEDFGVMGIQTGFIVEIDPNNIEDVDAPESNDGEVGLLEHNKIHFLGNWGVSIFGRKDGYYIIPGVFNIIYGDNYLLYKNIQKGKNNYAFTNINAKHLTSSSSRDPRFDQVVCRDITNANKYFGDFNPIKFTITKK